MNDGAREIEVNIIFMKMKTQPNWMWALFINLTCGKNIQAYSQLKVH